MLTDVAFASGPLDARPSECPQLIESDGRRFVWHPARRAPHHGGFCGPVVTVLMPEPADDTIGLLTNRFVSALSFGLDHAINIDGSMISGRCGEFDPPVAHGPAMDTTIVLPPVTRCDVVDDGVLHLVLGLYREGLGAGSPFYRMLSLFNALEATFGGEDRDVDDFVNDQGDRLPDPPPHGQDWATYFRDALRNAAAHAAPRRQARLVLDPNDPCDRRAVTEAARWLTLLVRLAILKTWENPVRIGRSDRRRAEGPRRHRRVGPLTDVPSPASGGANWSW